jgi:hypothetical protein
MDILTTKGKETIEQANRAIYLLERKYPEIQYIKTAENAPAGLDGVLVSGGYVVSACEIKCRKTTLNALAEHFKFEWLVSFDKIEKMLQISRLLGISALGLLYLVEDDLLLVQKIVDKDGNVVGNIRIETTKTQATVNGGSAVRTNAFIDMSKAIQIDAYAKKN